jgi:hypothetical protein
MSSRQDNMRRVRTVCTPLPATDEVDHLLSLEVTGSLHVVPPGQFDLLITNGRIPALRNAESAMVIHALSHYVVLRARRAAWRAGRAACGAPAARRSRGRGAAGAAAVGEVSDGYARMCEAMCPLSHP